MPEPYAEGRRPATWLYSLAPPCWRWPCRHIGTTPASSAIARIAGIAEDEVSVVTPDWILQFVATTWGWIRLIVGIVLFLAGRGIFSGNVLARTVGVLVAAGSAIVSFSWIPYYPV